MDMNKLTKSSEGIGNVNKAFGQLPEEIEFGLWKYT